jgi:hypothetical protein
MAVTRIASIDVACRASYNFLVHGTGFVPRCALFRLSRISWLLVLGVTVIPPELLGACLAYLFVAPYNFDRIVTFSIGIVLGVTPVLILIDSLLQ